MIVFILKLALDKYLLKLSDFWIELSQTKYIINVKLAKRYNTTRLNIKT